MDDALSQPVAGQGHGGIDAQPTEPYDEGTSVLLDDSVDSASHHVAVAADAEGSKGTTALGAGAAGVGSGGAGSVEGSSAADTSTAAAASAASTSGSSPAASRTTAAKAPATSGLSNPSLPLNPLHTPVDESSDSRTSSLSTAAAHAIEGFVQPSSYLRRTRAASKTMQQPVREETAVERDQKLALRSIRAFLKVRTSYDVLPISYRLIVFDTTLLVKKSLSILNQNGIVSAPLWDSKTSTFAGMLTTSDYINLIQYYWQNPDAMARIDQFRLDSLRDIEKAIGVAPIETISVHPMRPLYEACRRLIEARARRIPIIDIDDDTGRAMVVSVLTQYRLLKFVAINTTETQLLKVPLKFLPGVGTYTRIASADMDTPVIKVIHMLVSKQISSVPILNSDGVVVNVFEAVDVITLIKGGNYDCLTLPVGEALSQRAPDFPGIFTCSLDDRLDSIFDTIRKSRVHRFIIIDDANRLKGILTLSDILKYILLEGETEDQT